MIIGLGSSKLCNRRLNRAVKVAQNIIHCLIYSLTHYSNLVKQNCDSSGYFCEPFREFRLLLGQIPDLNLKRIKLCLLDASHSHVFFVAVLYNCTYALSSVWVY